MDIKDIYKKQIEFQSKVIEKYGYGKNEVNKDNLPVDDVNISSYHLLALTEEIGELIKSDKRWKNFRNSHLDKENKLEEVADCLICILNVCIFSGISSNEFENCIVKKMKANEERIE